MCSNKRQQGAALSKDFKEKEQELAESSKKKDSPTESITFKQKGAELCNIEIKEKTGVETISKCHGRKKRAKRSRKI